MRTTGVRSAPTPAPRSTAPGAGGPPQPLPRTKFPISTPPVKSPRERLPSLTQERPGDSNKHSNVASDVISDHLSPRIRHPRKTKGEEISGRDVPTKVGTRSSSTTVRESSGSASEPEGVGSPALSPPPKPPRTFEYLGTPEEQRRQCPGSPQPSCVKGAKEPLGPEPSSDKPARPKKENVLRRPGLFITPLVALTSGGKLAGDINSRPKPEARATTVASSTPQVEERTLGQSNVVASTSPSPSPSTRTAQVSAIGSSSQAISRGRQASQSARGNHYNGGSSVLQGNGVWSVETRRAPHKRHHTVPLPSASVVSPPPLPTVPAPPRPSVRPVLPSRPSSAQVAASFGRDGISRPQRRVAGASEAFPRPPVGTFLRSSSGVRVLDQDTVSTPADFDETCKQVFQRTRVAEEHMAKGRHVQAASEYQAALTAIDRVLKTQVLAITIDEPTRQRFFHQQQEVFYTRKEALNGFSDAQAAMTTPRGVRPPNQPRGAPPSYDDVIREDLSRSQDLLVSPCSEEPPALPTRQPTIRGPADVVGQPPVQRPAHRPALPQPSPALRASRVRSSSVCGREPGVVLVDVSGDAGPDRPSATPHTAPVTLSSQPLIPSRASLPRPKSSYHPGQDQATLALARQPGDDDPASQPKSNHHPNETRDPKSKSGLSRGETPSLEIRRSDNSSEAPVTESRSSPEANEALVHQARALRKFKEHRRREELASDVGGVKRQDTAQNNVASPPKHDNSPTDSVADAEGSVCTAGSRQPIMTSSPKGCDTSNHQVVHTQVRKDKVSSKKAAAVFSVAGSSASQTTTAATMASSRSSVIDPFTTVDPFPPVDPSEVNADVAFPDGGQSSLSTPVIGKASHNAKSKADGKPVDPKDSPQAPGKPNVSTGAPGGGVPVPDDVAQADVARAGSPASDDGTQDDLGDSILDALDFAISQTPSQLRTSFRRSKGSMSCRYHSEETLLDYSYRTLEKHLQPNKAICASRASIIEEFDPLASSSPEEERVEEKKTNPKENVSVSMDDIAQSRNAEPETVKPNLGNDDRSEGKPVITEVNDEEPRNGASSARACGEEGATAPARDIPGNTEGRGMYRDLCDSDGTGHPASDGTGHPASDGLGARSPSYPSVKSVSSWPPDYGRNAPCSQPQAVAPYSAGASGAYPWSFWSPEKEASEDPASAVGVGRSAFYASFSRQQDGAEGRRLANAAGGYSTFRDLLRIREGVKIFFVYEDGVVTSPWRRPFLAVSKDPNKAWLVGEGLVLRVDTDLWACQLHSKSTLVLHTLSGVYMFGNVAGKAECKAVGVQVPSGVKQSQHELLCQILRENTLLEDERPTGITKAISMSASSAASKMNQYVEDNFMTTNTAFIRRNSIRALKGMSKRLNNLAERTGSNMRELPAEYKELQEAADTLRLSRSAKRVQYI